MPRESTFVCYGERNEWRRSRLPGPHSPRGAAVEGTTVRDRAAARSPPPEQRATHVMSAERHGNWQDWPFDPLHVLRAFADAEVEYVLVGGLAAALQGSLLPT